jgi:hypothetical protein
MKQNGHAGQECQVAGHLFQQCGGDNRSQGIPLLKDGPMRSVRSLFEHAEPGSFTFLCAGMGSFDRNGKQVSRWGLKMVSLYVSNRV